MTKYDLIYSNKIRNNIEGELPREGESYELFNEGFFRVSEVRHKLFLLPQKKEILYEVRLSEDSPKKK
jgi:hypothetical protein